MKTSLSEQLKRLATPQTSLLLEDKKKPSLLFAPKDAANLDKETVLAIGQSGLKELIKLCNLFEEFEGTLFAQSSVNLERCVQDMKFNKKLNANVEKFLIFLSPYFLLDCAYKALEWLIYRFRIHQFSKDQYLMLILPYYETRIFVRALQLVDVSEPSDKWHWLKPVQKANLPLASITLVNRISSDNGFLKLICDHVLNSTKTYGLKATQLRTLYTFYTSGLVKSIHQMNNITDIQINHILPTLVNGLSSPIVDFAASNYIIISILNTKVKLKNETIDYILYKSFKRPNDELHYEVLLLLVSLFNAVSNPVTNISERLLIRLSNLSWFTKKFMKVKSSGVQTFKFTVLFLENSLRYILANPTESENVQNTVSDILTKIRLNDDEVDFVLSGMLKKNLISQVKSEESKQFLINLCKCLEICYPTKFDDYLKKIMYASENDEEAKITLQFLMSWHDGARDSEGSLEVLNSLTHASPEQRILALKVISEDKITITESFKEMVNKALMDRFNDDEDKVIEALLTFSTSRLKELFPSDVLVDKLKILVSNHIGKNRKMVAEPALKNLLEICKGNDASVFLVALPYLFPMKNEDVEIALEILDSNFGKGNKLMTKLKEDLGPELKTARRAAREAKDLKDIAEWFVKSSFSSLLNKDLLPPTDIIISTMKQQMDHGDTSFLFFNLILLGSVCRVPAGSLSFQEVREAIELSAKMVTSYKNVRLLPDTNMLEVENMKEALRFTSKGILPLQAATYVIDKAHRSLDLNTETFMFDFEKDPERSQLILKLIEIIFDGMANKNTKSHYEWCLKIFVKRHFSKLEDVLRFLSQLFNEPVQTHTSLHSLNITLTLLNNSKAFGWKSKDSKDFVLTRNFLFTDKIFVSNLLISLTSKVDSCREVAVSILKALFQKDSSTSDLSGGDFFNLLQELADTSQEINMDGDQLPLALYLKLSPDPDVRILLKSERLKENLKVAQELLFEIVRDKSIPLNIVSQLLEVLTHVNSPTILEQLAPLGLQFLEKVKTQPENKYISIGLTNILQRINSSTVTALQNEQVWKLFEMSISNHTPQKLIKNTVKSPSVILIKQIDETFFENLGKISAQLQKKVFSKLVDVITDCENSGVSSTASKVLQKIKINSQFIVDDLKLMTQSGSNNTRGSGTKSKKKLTRMSVLPNPEIINTHQWKRGINLLEFIKTENKIINEEILIPTLFDLLRTCLSFEIQDSVEYTNQLLLSALHLLASKSLPIRGAHLHIALIAQCIRISRNPQTHYYALSLLVELFKVADTQSALNSIMPIFTFVGSSILRQEDAYSIQITSKTIETIIPIVNAANNENQACEVLRLFITSLPDIPEHRRITIFVKLLQLMEKYLHLYYLLTFESHVLSQSNNESPAQKAQRTPIQKVEFALQICQEFPPKKVLNVCVQLVQFLKSLPIEVEEENKSKKGKFKSNHIFNVEKNSPKQLRHYKYTIVQFLSQLLSRAEFINRVAELDSETMNEMMPDFDKLIVELVLVIHSASKSADIHQGKPKAKYWKVLLRHLYDILDLVNSLLPNKAFIESIKRLTNHELLSVRRKALELLNARLQQRNFGEQDHEDLLSLMDSFTDILKGPSKLVSQEIEIIQQTVLISIKLLAKFLAGEHPENFKPILELTTKLVEKRSGPVLGSATACVGELCSSMRIHAIHSLNNFFPVILHLLEKQTYQEVPDVVMISVVCALQKIIETMANFMSPYLDQLLFELSRLNSLYMDSENPKIGIVISRLKATGNKLASSVPLRVLLPAVQNTYDELLSKKAYKYIAPLLNILAESFPNLQPSDLNAAMPNLITFFLNVLEFREQVAKSEEMEVDGEEGVLLSDIKVVEESASKAMVTLVLKLSEDAFRPFYYRLYDWAARNPQHKQRNITFYRLSATIADCLKVLMVLFAGHFLKHAALLLSTNNFSITDEVHETTLADESSRTELIEVIMLTLHRVFSSDPYNFVTQERFNILLQPIVDQIENIMGSKEEFEKRANDLIVPCIASFTSAIPDDSLQRQLVCQIILKSRHAKAYVRNTVVNCYVEIAKKLGEAFRPLLSDILPSLSELLEDEDEVVEKNARNAVRILEEILDEPLQKYF